MSIDKHLDDGNWHNLTMVVGAKSLKLFLNGQKVGEELDSASVHDFLDPYLTKMYLGGFDRDYFSGKIDTSSENLVFVFSMMFSRFIDKFELFGFIRIVVGFSGCLANLTINKELQPFNGTGSIFPEVVHSGQISFDCDLSGLAAIGVAVTDPLSLGITLVIVFFVILLMAITISFVVFKIRRQTKCDKDSDSGKDHFQSGLHPASPALNAIPVSSFMSETGDVIRHHMVPPELLSKRYKDQDMGMNDTHRPHRPDIIEREVVGKSPPPQRDELNQHMKNMHQHDSVVGDHDMPEHYDLENASSIAPSDIDIVYHYKSKRFLFLFHT